MPRYLGMYDPQESRKSFAAFLDVLAAVAGLPTAAASSSVSSVTINELCLAFQVRVFARCSEA